MRATNLQLKTIGVMGDRRTYEYVAGLRAVTSIDGMTADFCSFDRNSDAGHQRGEGRGPGSVRRDVKAAGDDSGGVKANRWQ
jgi:hypothetical protein